MHTSAARNEQPARAASACAPASRQEQRQRWGRVNFGGLRHPPPTTSVSVSVPRSLSPSPSPTLFPLPLLPSLFVPPRPTPHTLIPQLRGTSSQHAQRARALSRRRGRLACCLRHGAMYLYIYIYTCMYIHIVPGCIPQLRGTSSQHVQRARALFHSRGRLGWCLQPGAGERPPGFGFRGSGASAK